MNPFLKVEYLFFQNFTFFSKFLSTSIQLPYNVLKPNLTEYVLDVDSVNSNNRGKHPKHSTNKRFNAASYLFHVCKVYISLTQVTNNLIEHDNIFNICHTFQQFVIKIKTVTSHFHYYIFKIENTIFFQNT